jgi:hypothetical protein
MLGYIIYFHIICIIRIKAHNNKQIIVFNVRGSLSAIQDISVNITTPRPKPINLLGQVLPSHKDIH